MVTSTKAKVKQMFGIDPNAAQTEIAQKAKLAQAQTQAQNQQIAQQSQSVAQASATPKKLLKITDNPDGSTTLQYEGGGTERLTSKQEIARNALTAAQAGAEYKQKAGAKITPETQAMVDQQQLANTMPSQQAQNLALGVGQQQVDQNMLDRIGTQPEGINWGQAAGAGALQGTIAGALSGGALGAAAGLGVATPVTAVIGAVGGAVGGFINGMRSSIKQQLGEQVTSERNTLTKAQQNMKLLIKDTNANPANAADNLAAFNAQATLIKQAHNKLRIEANRNLNKWLGADATTQLRDYELYYAQGGANEILTQRMQMALLNPNPKDGQFTLEDITPTE